MDDLSIIMPDGTNGTATVLHASPRGTYASVKLSGTPHKGTVDVFHVGTGKRATPTRLFDKVRTQKVAKELADALDEYDPVDSDGNLRIPAADYHAKYRELVAADS